MLNNFTIQKDKKELVPAILHLDDTCRVQTVGPEGDLLYKAIELFYEKTGVPILCNTSLNDRGEPIIDNIDQAFNFALRKKIEVVYINGRRHKMTNFEDYKETMPLKRRNELFVKYSQNPEVCERVNPFGITGEEYNAYMNSNIGYDLNLQDERDVAKFKKVIKKVLYLVNLYNAR